MGKLSKISKVEKVILKKLQDEYELPQGFVMTIIPSEKYEERKLESGFVEKTGVDELNKHQLKLANDQREEFESNYFKTSDELLVAVTYECNEGKDVFCKIGDRISLNGHASIQVVKIPYEYINESGLNSTTISAGIIRAYDVLLKKK